MRPIARAGAAPLLGYLARGLEGVARAMGAMVLPPQCLACGTLAMEPGGICAKCWSSVEFIAPPLCDRTGLPFSFDPGPGVLSATALETPPAYARARAATRFGDVSRRLVHALKYRDRLETAPMMGRWMARAGAELIADCDFCMPVPLHGLRRWRRRYNQAALLAREVARAGDLGIDLLSLARIRATPPQVGLERDQRRRNVAGAFAVDGDRRGLIAGRRVLLIDDVITTGATVDAAASVLLEAGASAVDVLVFARVVDAGGATM